MNKKNHSYSQNALLKHISEIKPLKTILTDIFSSIGFNITFNMHII